MTTDEKLKEVLDKHVEIALSKKNPKEADKRLKSLNEILKEDTFINPKYHVILDDAVYFMRAYIEGKKAWFWIKDSENAGGGKDLLSIEINLKSSDEEKIRFNTILDYLMDHGDIA